MPVSTEPPKTSLFNMKTFGNRLSDGNEVQYHGLRNQGATCYLNAVLQCLFMTPELREEILSYKAPRGEENINLVQLQRLFRQLSEKVATTEGITRSLDIRNVFEQQDAVEYYRKILKTMGQHASKVFEGKMSNITKCGKCGKETPETNTFISILLSINVGSNEMYDVVGRLNTPTLSEIKVQELSLGQYLFKRNKHAPSEKNTGLEAFEKHSILDEDDWLYCDGCDCKTETETWSEIDEYPTVLTLHLKRFDFDYVQMRYEKNECRLDVPLNLPKKNNRPTYELYAVINHKGGYSGGHYDAVIKSNENGLWYRFDDYSVTLTSEAPLKNSSLPYMLMYRQKLFSPGSISRPITILLTGPSRAGKSTVGNIILGGNYFLCKSGSETVTKECTVKTVQKVTVVDTPNLFSLNNSSWAEEIEKCVRLSNPGPNVILWVTRISEFSEQQQGLFHAFTKRLPSETRKHMMIIFTNGRELDQSVDKFIGKRRKLYKVVRSCQDRYHVIDTADGHNYTSELLGKLSEMEASAIFLTRRKMLKSRERQNKKKKLLKKRLKTVGLTRKMTKMEIKGHKK